MTEHTPHDDGRAGDRSQRADRSRRTFLKTTAATAAGLGLCGVAASGGAAQSDGVDALVVNDFEGTAWPGGNRLGNWAGASAFERAAVVDGALRLEYDGAGQFGTNVRRDVTDYDRLELLVRGDEGGEESDIQIEIGGVQEALDVLVGDTADQAIGTSLSTVAVDLEAAGVDRSSVDDVWLNFFQAGSGAVEIEAIRFAGGSGEEPAEQTVSADLSMSQVSPDGTVAATIGLDSAPEGVSGYEITVSVGDSSVAQITEAAYPDGWFSQGTDIASDGSSATLQAVDANETVQSGAEDVELATVTLAAQAAGETEVGVSVTSLDSDADGAAIPATTTGGSLVVSDTEVSPIDGTMPRDIDGDGHYKDLNGNGEVDSDDVVIYFNNYDDAVITDHTDAYDFNDSGGIDFDDIVTLFNEL